MTKALKKFFPVFAGPTLLAFMIAFIVPFFMGLYLSFTKFSTLTNARFVGTDNYARALGGAPARAMRGGALGMGKTTTSSCLRS